jgi:hypothetical protein
MSSPNKDFSTFWHGNIIQHFFPFPVDYFFWSYSHYWDEIDGCYYYSLFQSMSCVDYDWEEATSFTLLDYKTELLPV